MSYTSHHPSRKIGPSPTLGDSLAALLSRLGFALRRWIAEYRTRHALMTLDDTMLKDIGLSRCDIDALARERDRT